jgi:serine/threonine-protein kinase
VPEAGGEAEVLTKPDTAHGELDHFWPEVLPGGHAVLFTIMSPGPIDTAQIALLNLETRTTKILLRGGTAAQYVPTGHLIYGVGGSLHAVPFDLERGEVTGDPIKVLEHVAITADGAVNATVSKDGALAYIRPRSAGAMRTIVWVNREGRETPIAGAPARPYTYPRVSPDGTRVALEVWDENRDIWVWDLKRETLTRLTDTPGRDGFPIWTPDSARVIFGSARGGSTNLYWRAAAGTGQVERITESPQIQFPYSMSSSGANILLREEHADTGLDVSVVPLNGDRRATTLLRTRFNELNAEISPDGRWFAYQSNESGQDEVYVRPFPEIGDDRQQVSTNGGTRPVWARNGRELFYLAPDGLFSVTVTPGPGFKLGSPLRLINRRYFAETAFIGRTYDVSPDGQRFLMIKDDAGDGVRPAIVVVQNWLEQLKARVLPR